MSLARDFADFADETNAALDGIVNEMAEQSKVQASGRDSQNALLEKLFERLGSIDARLVGLDNRLTVIQNGVVDQMRDFSHRLTRLEHDGTHPTEEATPARPRSALPR